MNSPTYLFLKRVVVLSSLGHPVNLRSGNGEDEWELVHGLQRFCRVTMSRPRAILWLLTLGFAGFGAAYACRPTGMAALTGIDLPSAAAGVDFMATYGGFQLGFAAFLAACAVRPGWVDVGLLASGWALLGFAVVRFLGILVNAGEVGATNYAGLVLEVFGAALAFSGWAWATEHPCDP